MSAYLILFAIVLGVNLLPAFGPPTWTIIVAYGLNSHMPLAALVVIGAAAAALGRFSLAHAFRALRTHIPAKTVRNLSAAGQALESRKHHSLTCARAAENLVGASQTCACGHRGPWFGLPPSHVRPH